MGHIGYEVAQKIFTTQLASATVHFGHFFTELQLKSELYNVYIVAVYMNIRSIFPDNIPH